MTVLFIALPIALLISLIAVIAFIWQVREGQLDDLDTPPRRILFDDVATQTPRKKTDVDSDETPPRE